MSYRVVVLQTAQSFEVNAGETVLDAALRQDVKLAHECTFGGCGTCRVRLVEGAVHYGEFPIALSAQEAEQGYALVCQARAQSDLVISTEPVAPPVCEPQLCTAVVRSVRALTPDVMHLSLDVAQGFPFDYRPGQYMNVLLEDGTHRSFSMASLPQAGLVDFHVRRIPGGRFTGEYLQALCPGDTFALEIPLGNFRLHKEDYRPLLMVATGTGLAPIKCMLESLMDDPDCPPVWLYWGMRTEADLYLDEQIRSWSARLYDFTYEPVLSRAGDGWQGLRGHVQNVVVGALPDLSEHSIYLCGSPDMIHDAKTVFLAHGASIDHIHSDGFSFQRPA